MKRRNTLTAPERGFCCRTIVVGMAGLLDIRVWMRQSWRSKQRAWKTRGRWVDRIDGRAGLYRGEAEGKGAEFADWRCAVWLMLGCAAIAILLLAMLAPSIKRRRAEALVE